MIDRRIKFRHIQVFVEIAQEKSFKCAAQKLFLSQPAISKTLKELEVIIGAELLQRSRTGVALTKQGELFLHFAQLSLTSLQQGINGVEKEGQMLVEQLSIGALPSVAAWLMPQVVAQFSAQAGNATLRIIDGPHAYLIERLRLGELDLVIGRMGTPQTMQGISFTQLYSEEVVLVVRPGHPYLEAPDIARIADWQLLYPPEDSAIRPWVDRWIIAQGISSACRRIETVSDAFGRSYVRNTDALWIISHGVVANEIADGRLVKLPFELDITQGPVGLMARLGRPITAAGQVFQIALTQVLKMTHSADAYQSQYWSDSHSPLT